MAKKTAPAAATPAELPDPGDHPEVIAVRARRADLAAALDATRVDRAAAERALGTGPEDDDIDLEARLLARAEDPLPVARLRELRRAEAVRVKALALVDAELVASLAAAVADLAPRVRDEVFVPAARRASAAFLAAAKEAESLRLLVEDIRARGLGNGVYSNLNGRVPLSLADRPAFEAFVRDLVDEGHADRAAVDAAFPGLLPPPTKVLAQARAAAVATAMADD